jgi:hypothetical protein
LYHQTKNNPKIMKLLRLLVIMTAIFCVFSTYGQSSKHHKSQNNDLSTQLSEENKNLHSYLKQLNQTISNVRDSIEIESKRNKQLDFESKKWQEATFNVNKSLQSSQKDLSTAQEEIRKLKYENELLKDPTLLRIYDVSPDKAQKTLKNQVFEKNLAFEFNEKESTQETIKATKKFEAGVFDKTEMYLILHLHIKPHLYDANRSLVYGFSTLLEKKDNSDEYIDQPDIDKISFFQEKALRLLEKNIKK